MRLAAKTLTYAVAHVAVATTVAWILTDNFAAALGIGLIEPIVQTGVFALHEHLWERSAARRKTQRAGPRLECDHGLGVT